MYDSSITAIINAVIFCVPLITLIVAIITFTNASKERHSKSSAEQAEIGLKLDDNGKRLADLQGRLDSLLEGYHENHGSIMQLETRVTGIEGRVKKVERDINYLENKVQDYHTKGI